MLHLEGGVLILILAVNFFLANQRKQRDNELITDQKMKLEELSGFKEGLTNMIAHDMKNSLNNIIGLSDMQPDVNNMHGIQQSGILMLNLVTNMLDVQRFEETRVPLNQKQFLVKELFDEAKSQTKLLLQARSLALQISVDENLRIEADFDIMVRVIVNLITNAIKYSKAGTKIWLIGDVDGANIVLKVRDEGSGIELDKIPSNI